MSLSYGRGAFLSLAGMGLALCVACSAEQPYEPEATEAAAPPPVEAVEDASPVPDTEAHEDHDDHAEHDAHADHDDDHDAHEEHGDHDAHDHHEDEHAGGEAHVHGAAELAVTQENNFVTISIDAPLANFGLSEKTKKKSSDLEKYAEGLTELMGNAGCDLVERSADLRRSGDHAAMTLSIVWDCRRPSQLDGLMFTGFETYDAFETVEAVYLGEAGEAASAVLTPESPFLPFGS